MLEIKTDLAAATAKESSRLVYKCVLYHPEAKRLYATDGYLLVWQEIEGDELGDEPLLLPKEAVQDAYRSRQPMTLLSEMFSGLLRVGSRMYEPGGNAKEHPCFDHRKINRLFTNPELYEYAVTLNPDFIARVTRALKSRKSRGSTLGLRFSLARAMEPTGVHVFMLHENGGSVILRIHDMAMEEKRRKSDRCPTYEMCAIGPARV